jgi:D-cysteine desulfhydrase
MDFVAGKPLLHQRFPELRESLPHVRLGSRSPVRRLDGLSEGVWLKDDGRYGDGPWGGNKIRKLEWILPDARRRGKRTILTFGALGTNHGLATALYAREYGLRVALALIDQPLDDHVRAQLERLRGSGATLHFTHDKTRTILAAPWLLARHRLPYFLPAGGSSPVGTLGYVEAGLELAEQVREGLLPEPSHVFVAVGSGGTAAGLALGLELAGLRSKVVGVVVNDMLRLDVPKLAKLARRAAHLLGLRDASPQLTVTRDWLGPGYGHATDDSTRALGLAHESAGLELEPVYTAKAMAGLLALLERGEIGGGPVLFVNTHGSRPAASASSQVVNVSAR